MRETYHTDLNPCRCDTCSYVEMQEGKSVRKSRTVQHWFCSSCGGGPYDIRSKPWFYRQQLPPTTDVATHLSPDVLYFCSAGCQSGLARENEQREALAAAQWATMGTRGTPGAGAGSESDSASGGHD